MNKLSKASHRTATWIAASILGVALLALPLGAAADPAQRVYVGLFLHDVTKFDQKDGVFDVDLEMWVKWLGDFDPALVTLTNAASVDRTLLSEETDGAWHSSRWRVRGTLRGEFPLHRFPFDDQTLSVTFELPDRGGELVPDLASSGMRERFSITGWRYDPSFRPNVTTLVYRSDLGSLAAEGRPTAVHRVGFDVLLHRPMLTVATKFFLPLIVILMVALIALFLPIDKVDARTGIGVTALLSCFAFQFAVADTMPNVAYVTIADVLFILSYALIAALLAVSIVAFFLDGSGRKRAARRLDHAARLSVPLAVLVSAIVLSRAPAQARVTHPAVRAATRHPSARGVLRIGTFGINNAMAGILGEATQQSCVRLTADGQRAPSLAEQAPSISNDSLHFLAGGAFEVVWRLRPGLRWSDGQPLTSADLAFAEQVAPDPHRIHVDTPDGTTVVVRYDDRIGSLLDDFTPMPRHVLEPIFRRSGYEGVREYRRTHIVPTAGPYRLVEYVADDHAVLEANPNFYGGPPAIRRIEFRRFADSAAAVAAFDAGQIDLTWPNTVTPEAVEQVAARRPDVAHQRAADTLVMLNPDLNVPLLARLDVRRAILLAIDRERIRAILGTEARIADIPIPGEPPASATRAAHDPIAARALIESAGVAGSHVAMLSSSSPLDRAITQQIVADLAAVGLVVDTRVITNGPELFRNRRHGGLLLHATNTTRTDPARRFWSVPIVQGSYDRAARNAAYTDVIAQLAEREERAMYPERREQLRDRIWVAFSENLPNLLLAYGTERVLADPQLVGWRHQAGVPFGRGVEEWYFEAGNAPGR